MVDQLHGTHFASGIRAGDAQPAVFEQRAILGVDSKATIVALDDLAPAVDLTNPRSAVERDLSRRFAERTRQRCDERHLRVGVRLSMVGGRKVQDIAGVFEQRMLAPPARPKKRPTVFAREPDRSQHAVH
ncbi:MAG TPA: hypothetical protein VGJ87_22075, partial [Roseiflexaceae bacterium]